MIEVDLDNLSRADLQKLAKEYGVKANQKNTKLISALKKLVTKKSTEEVDVSDDTEEDTPGLNEELGKQESTTSTDDKEEALKQVYINKVSTPAKDEATAVPYISPVKVVEFMTDDESTQSKSPAKNNPNATFETDNLSIISEFMTEDEESLAANCSKTGSGRMLELSQLNQTSSESNTKSDDDKLAAPVEEVEPVKVDNSTQSTTKEAPCAGKLPSKLSCRDNDAKAECQVKTEVAQTPAFYAAADHQSTVDAAESGSGNGAENENHAEDDDKAAVVSTPNNVAGNNSPGLNDTFSVKKPTSARRRPKIAPPQPNKEVAKQTTFAEWQKERRQRRKGTTTKNCRRSPRIRSSTAETETPQADTSSSAAASKTRKVTKNIPKTPVPPITPKNIPKTPVPPITPKNVTKTPAKSSKKAASTPKASSKKATESKATGGARKVKDFRKLHENMFEQMESIYEHRDRKKQRAEKMLNSTKKQSSTSAASGSAVKTTGKSAKRIFESSTGEKQVKKRKMAASTTDVPTKTKEDEPGKKEAKSKLKVPTRWSQKLHAASSKPASSAGAGSAAVFKPSVTEVKNIKTNFSLKTPVKFSRSRLLERKPAAVKTEQAAAASTSKKLQTPKKVVVPRVSVLKTPAKENLKSVTAKSTPAKTHITPFKVGGNSFVESPRFKKFDIKESLKRPLNYVPHKGPLKEYTDTTKVGLKTLTATSKQKQNASRIERRREAQTNRSNARSNVLMKKRAGLH